MKDFYNSHQRDVVRQLDEGQAVFDEQMAKIHKQGSCFVLPIPNNDGEQLYVYMPAEGGGLARYKVLQMRAKLRQGQETQELNDMSALSGNYCFLMQGATFPNKAAGIAAVVPGRAAGFTVFKTEKGLKNPRLVAASVDSFYALELTLLAINERSSKVIAVRAVIDGDENHRPSSGALAITAAPSVIAVWRKEYLSQPSESAIGLSKEAEPGGEEPDRYDLWEEEQ